MKILILYSTVEGHTRKIARFMEGILQKEGHQVTLIDAKTALDPNAYDAVLIGSSIHIGQYNNPVRKYIKNHVGAIRQMPNAFFTVCLGTASDHVEGHEEAARTAEKFFTENRWEPQMHMQVPGALKYTQYGFLKKFVLKRVAKKEGLSTDTTRDHEFTDWDAVRGFVKSFSKMVKTSTAGAL